MEKDDLKEIISDYIQRMEGVHNKRLDFAEREMQLIQAECRAFNILRQKLDDLGNGNAAMNVIRSKSNSTVVDDQVDF